MKMDSAFDLIIGLSLTGIAWRIIQARDHFQAIVLFITFGLLLSLAWTRLNSPDIAIAEAAVGAGLAGVLLMDTLGFMSSSRKQSKPSTSIPLLGACICLAGLTAYSILYIPVDFHGLSSEVQSALPQSGLMHPVTAVLLDFRGYDTWLELGVLLAAVLGVLCLGKTETINDSSLSASAEPVESWVIKILLPLIILIGGYLLWLGAFAPGGAFQAGVVLAAGGVMLWQAGHPFLRLIPRLWRQIIMCAGFASFLVLALWSLLYTEQLLTHPENKIWILGVEYAATLSIAMCLISLVSGSPARKRKYKKQ
ncbi:MAG: hydrogenase subunit MbhD domain-containing protein [Desulfonatronovibrio sp.]